MSPNTLWLRHTCEFHIVLYDCRHTPPSFLYILNLCCCDVQPSVETRVRAVCHRKKVYLKIKLYPSYSSRTVNTKEEVVVAFIGRPLLWTTSVVSQTGCWPTASHQVRQIDRTKIDTCFVRPVFDVEVKQRRIWWGWCLECSRLLLEPEEIDNLTCV